MRFESKNTMENLLWQAGASAVFINLVHWSWTRRGGFWPKPSGVIGTALDTWMFFAGILAIPTYFGLSPLRLWTMFFGGWMLAASLCAVCVRQVSSPTKTPRVDARSQQPR